MIHDDPGQPPRPSALTLEELRTVLDSAELRRTLFFSRHARLRSSDRNITYEDVVQVCLTGGFNRAPRYENENWKYEVKGKDLDEGLTTVVIAVDNDVDKCWVTIITVF